jgi:N-acetylmuramoyl-L-alanine amidase
VRILSSVLLAGVSLAAWGAELRDVRIWAGPDGTRVVFDLDAGAQHTLFTLDNPHRVVIDLAATRRAGVLAAQLEGKGLVQRVRSAEQSGALRVVLDLAGPVGSKSFALPPNESYGYRVVIDLAATRRARPWKKSRSSSRSTPATAVKTRVRAGAAACWRRTSRSRWRASSPRT